MPMHTGAATCGTMEERVGGFASGGGTYGGDERGGGALLCLCAPSGVCATTPHPLPAADHTGGGIAADRT